MNTVQQSTDLDVPVPARAPTEGGVVARLTAAAVRLVARRDVAIAFGGGLACVLLASILMSGWPAGLLPNLHHPFVYAGDALSHYAMVERAIEGWIWNNPRSGFPFGSPWNDYPGSDAGNLLVLKIVGLLTGSFAGAANGYFLLGFGVSFAIAFVVLREIGVRRPPATAAAVLFAFAAYHFARLMMGHMFYTWYFPIPVYFYAGAWLFGLTRRPHDRRMLLALGAALFLVASFGVYFALFGTFTMMICGLAAALRDRRWQPLWLAVALCGAVTLGVEANVAPTQIYHLQHGPNPQIAQRLPAESEYFAFKPVHLVIPPLEHRIERLQVFAKNYVTQFPLTNTVSYVGIVGVFGLLAMALVTVRSLVGRPQDPRLGLASLLALATMLIATVGGLNVLFALFVSPMIRGWDRFGIFVDFYALAALAVFVDRRPWKLAGGVLLAVITLVGVLDQSGPSSLYVAVSGADRFDRDQALVRQMEAMLPRGAAVYQLPYVGFPEHPPVNNLGSYEPLAGFLHSRELRWSYGGMWGREADRFYSELARKPLADQVAEMRRRGFAAVYLMRAGYADGGAAAARELTQLLGAPVLQRADGQVSVFLLQPPAR